MRSNSGTVEPGSSQPRSPPLGAEPESSEWARASSPNSSPLRIRSRSADSCPQCRGLVGELVACDQDVTSVSPLDDLPVTIAAVDEPYEVKSARAADRIGDFPDLQPGARLR